MPATHSAEFSLVRERQRNGRPPSLEARYRDRADYEQKVSAAAQRVVALGFLREEEVSNLVAEAGSFYDRVVAHDPADRSCRYLFPK